MKKRYAYSLCLFTIMVLTMACRQQASEIGKWDIIKATYRLDKENAVERPIDPVEEHSYTTFEFTGDGIAKASNGPGPDKTEQYTRSGDKLYIRANKEEGTHADTLTIIIRNDGKEMVLCNVHKHGITTMTLHKQSS